jgi:hypothetical protein
VKSEQIEYAADSVRAIGVVDHETADGVAKLESVCSQWLKAIERSKWPSALQAFENASYLLGNHTTRYYFDTTQGFGWHAFGVHDSSRFDALIAKCADNHLIRPIETVVGLLTEARPEPRIEPNSDSIEDEDAARIGEAALQVIFEHPIKLTSVRREAAMIAMVAGTAVAETYYGPTGDPMSIPKVVAKKKKNPFYDENDPALGPEYETVMEQDGFETGWRSDFQCRLYTPMHISTDPTATRPEELGWISRTTFEDVDALREKFDIDEPGYYPEVVRSLGAGGTGEAINMPLFWWLRFQDIIASPQTMHSGGMSPSPYLTGHGLAPNQVLTHVIDVRPTAAFPRGRTLVVAGGKLIYCSPKEVGARAWSEQYPDRWHPYSFFHWFKLPGRFWGIPLLSKLVPLQKKINAIDAVVHANRTYLALGQWLLPRHAKMAEGRIGGVPGDHYTYIDVPGMKGPERVKNDALPGDLLNERALLAQSIDRIAASGVVDPNATSASALRSGEMLNFFLQEKLRSKAPMLQGFEEFLESIAQNILIDVQLNLLRDDPVLTAKIRAAARKTSNVSLQFFTGASLRDHNSVRIDISTELRHTPEADRENALTYLQMRQNPAPQEIHAVMKAIRLDKFMVGQQDRSINRARRMIARIKAGMLQAFLPIDAVDDAAAMAPVFADAILDETFLDLHEDQQKVIIGGFDYYNALASQAAAAVQQQQLQTELALKGLLPEQQLQTAQIEAQGEAMRIIAVAEAKQKIAEDPQLGSTGEGDEPADEESEAA